MVKMTRSKTFQAYLPSCHRTYSCIHCRAHLANHDELISKDLQVCGGGRRTPGCSRLCGGRPENADASPRRSVACRGAQPAREAGLFPASDIGRGEKATKRSLSSCPGSGRATALQRRLQRGGNLSAGKERVAFTDVRRDACKHVRSRMQVIRASRDSHARSRSRAPTAQRQPSAPTGGLQPKGKSTAPTVKSEPF
uniref:Yippee domain-containing protein n=1 Tax=Apteryx owenii TaxID=8824 RepID=A0A8B9QBC0_APTOW